MNEHARAETPAVGRPEVLSRQRTGVTPTYRERRQRGFRLRVLGTFASGA